MTDQRPAQAQQKLRETPWHTLETEKVVSELGGDPERGLSVREAKNRLEHYGPNRIRSGEMVPWWRIAIRQVADPLIYILLLAAAVSGVFGEYVDAAVILAVVAINGAIGFVQEFRARKAIQALSAMSAPKARVVRDGEEREIPSEKVAPGDLVLLAAGGRVPADLRLLHADDLRIDESALTGESEPATKQVGPVEDEHAVPGDQFSVAFAGTVVTRGRGRGIAVRTGDASELGSIAEETLGMAEVETPIQQKMHWLGKAIGVAVLVFGVIVVAGGYLAGMELAEIVRTAVALAVGAVPEALPIVLTVTLAVGVQRMAKRNAIIRSLPAVETLGSCTVVGSDKTGTLTANQMTVKVVWAGGERFEVSGTGYDAKGELTRAEDGGGDEEREQAVTEAVRQMLLAGLLANEAKSLPGENEDDGGGGGGDPTELALLVSATKAGYDLRETREKHPQVAMIPFESDRQFMATLNDTPDGRYVFLKGSPEAVLERCSRQLARDGEEEDLNVEAAREMAGRLADEGYRVLGMALGRCDAEGFDGDDPGSDLTFAGFQAIEDPVRPEAVEAVKAARAAGIRVLMLTGDHLRTARAIGARLGLVGDDGRVVEGRNLDDLSDDELDETVREVNVYARVSPKHKLRLVERLKAQGHVVAVTGDGVNDAPALQAAHLGVAMGKAGTDVAREASDMVLADDNFASITNAIEEGRIVFSNIRKVTYFLLSTNIGLVIAILASLFGPWPLPFVAVQVLWINLVTKGLQDVSLAFEPGEPGLLDEPPRDPAEGVIHGPVFSRMISMGAFMAVVTLAVFLWILWRGASLELARSAAMTQMVMLQFFHVFNCRSFLRSIFAVPLRANPYVVGSVLLSLVAHLAILHIGLLQVLFETEPLSLGLWGIIMLVSLSVVVVAEIDKALLRRPAKRAAARTESRRPSLQ
jgi:magnesium-transporting ATPase (P-type)